MIDIKFIKRSSRINPKVTLVLLDWSVRESFHILHYLYSQTINRNEFEVIVIEYFDRVSEKVREFEEQVDSWVTLGMPKECHYHKHLMYNVGISLAKGEIITICDSDAMVKNTFIKAIVSAFDEDKNIVLHLDQFRNTSPDYYPFNFPQFDQVMGDGCINNAGGKTLGIVNDTDPIHVLNYGACMCARRDDLIAIGGADEHIDYLGHICGPYDMTFRLIGHGRREVWHQSEFLYHTWHPGQAGANNYMGPHDSRHMSSTALEALITKRVVPHVENQVIQLFRQEKTKKPDELLKLLINPDYVSQWNISRVESLSGHNNGSDNNLSGHYNGYRYSKNKGLLEARPIRKVNNGEFNAASINEFHYRVNYSLSPDLVKAISIAALYFSPIQLYKWMKEFVRNILAHGYRALKFRDHMSITAFYKVVHGLPNEIIHTIGSIKTDIDGIKGRHGSLAVLIFNQKIGTQNLTSKQDKVIVLVNNRLSVQFLKRLRRINIIPDFEFEYVLNTASVTKSLRRLENENSGRMILVWGELYTRFHSTFISSPLHDQLVIV